MRISYGHCLIICVLQWKGSNDQCVVVGNYEKVCNLYHVTRLKLFLDGEAKPHGEGECVIAASHR